MMRRAGKDTGSNIWHMLARTIFACSIFLVCMILCAMTLPASAKDISAEDVYTESEKAYMESGKPIRLAFLSTREPVSYEEDGEPAGIVVDILKWMEEASGLPFEYILVPAGINPVDYVVEDKADVAVGVLPVNGNMDNPYITLTDCFFSSELILVARNGIQMDEDREYTVLTNKGFTMAKHYLEQVYPEFKVEFSDTVEDALRAVRLGNADLAFQNVYVLNEFLKKPAYQELSILLNSIADEDLVMAVSDRMDPELVPILNKLIERLPEARVRQIVLDYTIARVYNPTMWEYIQMNWLQSILVLCSFLSIIIIAMTELLLHSRRKLLKIKAESGKAFENIANNINGGVITITKDENYVIQYANEGFLRLIGMTKEEYEKQGEKNITRLIREDDRILFINKLTEKWEEGKSVEAKVYISNQKEYVPVLLKGTVSKNTEDDLMVFCVLLDIEREEALISELEEEKEMYRLIAGQLEDILFYLETSTGKFSWPESFENRFGRPGPKQFKTIEDWNYMEQFIEEEDRQAVFDFVNTCGNSNKVEGIRFRAVTANERIYWYELQLRMMEKNGRNYRVLGKLINVDSQMRDMERLSHASQTDELTGLHNKKSFYAMMETYLRQTDNPAGVMLFMDIDNFKLVNDRFGHLEGDELLKKVATMIREAFRKEDILARFGGDEFVIFVKNMDAPTAERKIKSFTDEIKTRCSNWKGSNICISASVGASILPEDGATAELLIEKADAAMYEVKKSEKGGYHFYGQHTVRRQTTENMR